MTLRPSTAGAPTAGKPDVRTLLGMRTPAAWAIFSLNALASLLWITTNLAGLQPKWPVFVAFVIVASAGSLLLLVAGEPLPAWVTWILVLCGPVAVVVTVPFIPTADLNPHQVWMMGALTGIFTFMCVRGRTLAAWCGLILTSAAVLAWAASTEVGVGTGVALTFVNLAPLAMATFFGYIIRPAVGSIFALKERETARAAAEATATAILGERDRRIAQLDLLARPLLEAIAEGELTTGQRHECALLEAHLRDILRAPELATEPVVGAARRARERGIEVILLGEGALAHVSESVCCAIRSRVAEELDHAVSGTVTARIVPPGRGVLGTVVASSECSYRRVELDHAGVVTGESELTA